MDCECIDHIETAFGRGMRGKTIETEGWKQDESPEEKTPKLCFNVGQPLLRRHVCVSTKSSGC
jgi:hypothetical protein